MKIIIAPKEEREESPAFSSGEDDRLLLPCCLTQIREDEDENEDAG